MILMEREGANRSSGKADEAKGRVKESVGALTGNKKLKREGKADQVAGKVEQSVKEVVDKVKTTLA
jgi:uncharacterized protein YjbJ (UPF0337 family)